MGLEQQSIEIGHPGSLSGHFTTAALCLHAKPTTSRSCNIADQIHRALCVHSMQTSKSLVTVI